MINEKGKMWFNDFFKQIIQENKQEKKTYPTHIINTKEKKSQQFTWVYFLSNKLIQLRGDFKYVI